MKKTIGLIILLLTAAPLWSQQDSTYFQVGVNVMRLLTMNQPVSELWNPYQLHVEWGNGQVGARVSLNVVSTSETEEPSSFNGNTRFSDDSTSMDLRVGAFMERRLGKSWSTKFAADFFITNRDRAYNTVTRDVDGLLVKQDITSSRSEVGGSISLIPEWHITSRVTLSTELNLLLASTSSSTSTRSSDFPEFNSIVDKGGNYVRLRPPTALFLLVRF